MKEAWNKVAEDITGLERKEGKDIYVIVAEKGASDGGGIVFEQELHDADIEEIKKRIARIGDHSLKYDYGKFRIAKLVFIDEGK